MAKELVGYFSADTDVEEISDAIGERMKELGLAEEDTDGESEDRKED